MSSERDGRNTPTVVVENQSNLEGSIGVAVYVNRAPGGPRITLPNYGGLPFVGRSTERDTLENAFSDGDRPGVVVLHGEPGVGKTHLAVEYALAHLGRYPGGVFFVRFNALPPLDLVEVLRLLGMRDYDTEPFDAQCRRALRSLGAEPTLLLYDGVASEADLNAWLPPGGVRCHVLATSTSRDWTARHTSCPVPTLPDPDARSIAAALLGKPELAARYVEGLVRHARGIAVELCASAAAVMRAAAHGVAPDLELLAEKTRESFGLAWALLPEDARLLLRTATLFEESRILTEQLRELLEGEGWQRQRFEQALEDAIDRYLLTPAGDVLRMHSLFRRFAFEQDVPELGGGLLRRYATASEEVARSARENPVDVVLASRLLSYPGAASWDRFAEVLRGAAGKVAHSHGDALRRLGKWDAARDWYHRAVGAESKGDAHGRVDHTSLGGSLYQLGICLLNMNRFDEARGWLERAAASFEKGDVHGRVDHETLGVCLNNAGYCLSAIGRFDEAQEWFTRAVASHEKGNIHGLVNYTQLGISLNEVGYCLLNTGQFDEARMWLERAVASHEKGDMHGLVDYNEVRKSLNQIVLCLLRTSRFDEARPWYERAIASNDKGDINGLIDHKELAICFSNVGFCLLIKGQFDEACSWYERSIVSHEKGDIHGRIDRKELGTSLFNIGHCLFSMGRLEDARSWYERAVDSFQKGDLRGRVDQVSIAESMRALDIIASRNPISARNRYSTSAKSRNVTPVIQSDHPCPCGSGAPFGECHGATDA